MARDQRIGLAETWLLRKIFETIELIHIESFCIFELFISIVHISNELKLREIG